MNPIKEYYKQITMEEVIVSDKVKTVYKYLNDELANDKSDYVYDEKKAMHAIDFIQCFCKHSKGKVAGKPFILELWQKAFIAAIFGFIHKDSKLRRFREAMLIVGRKNGKSALASAIGLYLLYADNEAGAEIYSAATKKDQAKIIWKEAGSMIKKSPHLRKYSKIYINEIKCYINEGIFKPLASDSDSLDGLNVHGALIDELHAIKDKNLYDVIVDGMGARSHPLTLITSTAGTIRDNIFDLKYEEASKVIDSMDNQTVTDFTLLPVIYELDSREEVEDSNNWQKANPGIGTIKNIDTLAVKVNKALEDSRLLPNLLCKEFNLPVNASTQYFSAKEIINSTVFNIQELNQSYYIGGWDLSQVTDLTSACLMFKESTSNNVYFESMYWIPADKLDDLERRDKKPYSKWLKAGYLKLCDGNSIKPYDIGEWFSELSRKYGIYPYKFGYDMYGSGYLTKQLAMDYGKDVLEVVRQGKQTLSIPMQLFKTKLQKGEIIYNNNPITAWNLACVEADIDINGNIQPSKKRNKDGIRIDGFAAMLDAFTVYLNHEEEFNYYVR